LTALTPGIPTRPVEVTLTTELLAGLTTQERALLPLLLAACAEMDEIFWLEASGERSTVLSAIADPDLRSLVHFNYGPWDRRQGNAPLVPGIGPKPAGARFYPPEMDVTEFEVACAESADRAAALRSPYSVVRRDSAGKLVAVAYHEAFAQHVERASTILREAAEIADDPALRRYLTLRAEALRTDDYRASELAWLDMKDAGIDLIIGPVEEYEDALFGRKTAHEGILLLKDRDRSARFDRVTALLPQLQSGLPVPDSYKLEVPSLDGGIGVYDVIAYSGDASATSPDAITLPNDEDLQLEKGTRRLQLRNAMRVSFDLITAAVAASVIAADQRGQVEFEAYFAFVMCHEIAHGLGVKRTIVNHRPVSDALLDQHSAVEEGKADVVGLHMLARLIDSGDLPDTTLLGCYVTYMAELVRQIRKGSASGYARANLANLDFLRGAGAIMRNDAAGTYEVDVQQMREAIDILAARYLRLQGDGDYAAALAFIPKAMDLTPALQADLDRLTAMSIPNAIRFKPAIETNTLANASAI
jgi:Peptidase family M49